MNTILFCFLFFCIFHRPQLQALSWLKTHNGKIVDEQQQEVQLQGINLGGWLVEELWLKRFKTHPPKKSTLPKISDHVTLWHVFSSRFSPKTVGKIRSAMRKAWLDESDFERIKKAGFNCVRLPFMHEISEDPKTLFYWLDYAIDAAEKHGLYVIIDMHGAPGGQSPHDHTGIDGCNWFFSDPAMIEKAISLWEEIAKRYKERPSVAGFDLLNEPSGASNTATLYLVQDRIYRAIRKWDSRHIIIIEDGFKGVDRIPDIRATGWHTVAISTHLYTHHLKSEQEMKDEFKQRLEQLSLCQKKYNVPIYIGEFNQQDFTTKQNLEEFLLEMKNRHFSWSFWTYKVAGGQNSTSPWGLYVAVNPERIDPFRDSKHEILGKIEKTKTEYCTENQLLLSLFRN
jgi:endoglucanase